MPKFFNYTGDVIGARADETPDKVALIGVEPDGLAVSRYTFADLAELAHRTAHLLRHYGIGKGDRAHRRDLGSRQSDHRSLQIPPRDHLLDGTAEDDFRQDPKDRPP